MRRSGIAAVILALSCLLSTAAVAQEAHVAGLVGLLFLPEVFGARDCDDATREDVLLYAAPDEGEVIGRIRAEKDSSSEDCFRVTAKVHLRAEARPRELPTQEYREEEPVAAIVLEARAPWFRIRLREGSAWVKHDRPDKYLPLEDLLREGRTFLTAAWDGRLSATPGGPGRRALDDPRRRLIGYVEPVLEWVRVVLEPGQDQEAIRKQYGASSMASEPGPNGTRILHIQREAVVDAFERPDRRAPVVARLRTNDAAQGLRGSHDNPPKIAVFARRSGWLQVGLRQLDWKDDPRAWIEATSVWRFHGLSGEARRSIENEIFGEERPSVAVPSYRRVHGALWLHVQVLSHTIYESVDPPRVVAAGWVRATDSTGAPIVWFHSRD